VRSQLSDAERISVVNAHPRIGAPTQTLSALSAKEQGGAAASNVDPAVLQKLLELNEAYEKAHGFRFVVFVNGRSRAAIVPIMEARIGNPTDRELDMAISEMMDIARDRLRKLQPKM
jgi:2-oxo-4-hydroxy-4-carboxy--5-ureidoimidazoline (OHCU) decarboxylase